MVDKYPFLPNMILKVHCNKRMVLYQLSDFLLNIFCHSILVTILNFGSYLISYRRRNERATAIND